MRYKLLSFLSFCVGIFAPFTASAHEVYVLSPEIVAEAMRQPAFSEWQVVLANLNLFLLSGAIAIFLVVIIFFVSISRRVEQICDPLLARLPRYAPSISRITIGVSFLAAVYANALFGPELPLASTFGTYAELVRVLLGVIGVLITLGIFTRLAAVSALVLFGIEVFVHGSYMFTYTNYFGELVLLLLLGAHSIAFQTARHERKHLPSWVISLKSRLAPFTMLLLRVSFGISLLYASLYAKVIHNELAFAVTVQYPAIVSFFGFEPHFLVLGAAIVEIVIALFFILGIEIRFTALFVLFWLSLSLWYFGEAVWPHIILIGIPVAFICYGYDRYSLEGYFFKRGGREPVL